MSSEIKTVDLSLSKELEVYLKIINDNLPDYSRLGISAEHLGTPTATSATTQKNLINDTR